MRIRLEQRLFSNHSNSACWSMSYQEDATEEFISILSYMVEHMAWRTPSINQTDEEVSHILLIIKSATWLWYRMKYSLSRNNFLILGNDGFERACIVHNMVLLLNQFAETIKEIKRLFACV